jgi:hypothetical protein
MNLRYEMLQYVSCEQAYKRGSISVIAAHVILPQGRTINIFILSVGLLLITVLLLYRSM